MLCFPCVLSAFLARLEAPGGNKGLKGASGETTPPPPRGCWPPVKGVSFWLGSPWGEVGPQRGDRKSRGEPGGYALPADCFQGFRRSCHGQEAGRGLAVPPSPPNPEQSPVGVPCWASGLPSEGEEEEGQAQSRGGSPGAWGWGGVSRNDWQDPNFRQDAPPRVPISEALGHTLNEHGAVSLQVPFQMLPPPPHCPVPSGSSPALGAGAGPLRGEAPEENRRCTAVSREQRAS